MNKNAGVQGQRVYHVQAGELTNEYLYGWRTIRTVYVNHKKKNQ